MGGLFLVGFLILLIIKVWPFALAALAIYVLWRWVFLPAREAQAHELRERLRHEAARREIDRIALQTSRAMFEAAGTHSDVIEGYAEEVEG